MRNLTITSINYSQIPVINLYDEKKYCAFDQNVPIRLIEILAGRPVPWTGLLKCKIEMPYPPCPSPPGGGEGQGVEVGGGDGGRADSRGV